MRLTTISYIHGHKNPRKNTNPFLDPMAYHHHQNHHPATTSYCCCPSPPPCHPQTPPLCYPQPPTADPFHMASLISQLLQTPIPQTHHSLHDNISQNQRFPQTHLHQQNPLLLSLLHRIDALESSLQRYASSTSSSGYCSSVRDAAARTIQAHFRAYLVHRSRTLRHLKELGNIKSALASFNSLVTRHGFVDFDSISQNAMDLLLKLDSIQSGDRMIRDSKRTVTKEIVEFLDLVDGIHVKKHQALTRKVKSMRFVRNDRRSTHDAKEFSAHNVGSKVRNVDNEEKKIMANLRDRVEKIGRLSRVLEEQERDVFGDVDVKGYKHVDGKDDAILGQIAGHYRLKNGLDTQKNAQSSNAQKHVCFMEDGNLVRLYDIDGNSRSAYRLVDVIEDSTKRTHDEEEAQSDSEGSSQSSEEIRKFRNDQVIEEYDKQDEEFTFSTTPEAAKMDTRADFVSRKPGVKIVG